MNIESEVRKAQQQLQSGDLSGAADTCLSVLRQKPDSVPVIEIYGRVAEEMRRFEEAQIIFQKLLKASPQNVVAHERLSLLYFEQGDRYHAGGHAKKALQLDPGLVSPHVVLGSIALVRGEVEEGDRHFASALERAADKEEVKRAKVSVLRTTGDFDQANWMLRELIAAAPDEAQYHEFLSHSTDLKNNDGDAALILSLLDDKGELREAVSRSEDRSLSACVALSRLYAARGEYSRSFETLERAKAIRRTHSRFDVAEAREAQVQFNAVFDKGFVESHRDVGSPSDEAIFILGMPRSGTTLLERVMASSEAVVGGGELSIAQRLMKEACAAAGSNQNDFAALKKLPAETWRQLGEEYLRRARQQLPQSRYLVDKHPSNTFILGFIRTMLPQAKLVHSMRNPVATCFSIYEQNFHFAHDYANDLSWLGDQYLHYREVMGYWHSLYPGEIIDITYEGLVSDRGATLQMLEQRLGLEGVRFDLAAEKRGGGEIRTASIWQARQAVHTRSVARWEHYREQLKPLLSKLAPLLDEADRA